MYFWWKTSTNGNLVVLSDLARSDSVSLAFTIEIPTVSLDSFLAWNHRVVTSHHKYGADAWAAATT